MLLLIFFIGQFYNMIKQSAIEKLGLKQMKRDFYDPGGVINKPEWNIALWPGNSFITNFAIFTDRKSVV